MREKLHHKNISYIKEIFLEYKSVYSQKDLYNLLFELKEKKLVAQNLTSIDFFTFLQESLSIKTYSVYSEKIKKERYSIKELDNYQLSNSFEKDSFFSMTTALNIQGLSSFMNNFIFYSKELTPKYNPFLEDKVLKQIDIDNAYSKPYRKTKNIAEYKNNYFIYLTPKHTSQAGVIKYGGYYVSSINRVLIEMIINVQYFKSYKTVIDCFQPISNKLEPNEIYKILKEFDLIYPYFQLFGFTLEKLGFKKDELKIFKEQTKSLIFYTQKFNNINNTSNNNTYWNIKEFIEF